MKWWKIREDGLTRVQLDYITNAPADSSETPEEFRRHRRLYRRLWDEIYGIACVLHAAYYTKKYERKNDST